VRWIALLPLGLALTLAQSLPWINHAFVIVLENRSYDQVIGNPNLPYLNDLARTYGLAARYYGAAHPSLPNYVAMIAGRTFGSRSDDPSQRFYGPTLVEEMDQRGLSWKAYMQDLPYPGFLGDYAGSPVLYGKKHDPFLLFPAIAHSPQARRVVPLHQLFRDLRENHVPNLAFIVPDLCNDLHGAPSCPLGPALDQAGDAFVRHLVTAILKSPAWTGHSVIFIVFDEGGYGPAPGPLYAGGRSLALVVVRGAPHRVSQELFDPYSLLRTLERAWHLPLLGHAAQVHSFAPFFP